MIGEDSIKYEDDESRAAVKEVFGYEMSPDDIGSLAGARDNDLIKISGGGSQFEVEMHSAAGERYASFTVSRSDQGIVVSDIYVRNSGGAQGAGRDLVETFDDMKALGVTKMEASAVRSDGGRLHGMNGYYTWAKLGFTGQIPESILDEAQAQFGTGITHVEQLIRLGRVGERWWKEHGDTWEATFNFEDGSYSMRMLNAWRGRINRTADKVKEG